MQPATQKASLTKGARKKKVKRKPEPTTILIPLAGKDDAEVLRASKRVEAVRADIRGAQARLEELEKQLEVSLKFLRTAISKLPSSAGGASR